MPKPSGWTAITVAAKSKRVDHATYVKAGRWQCPNAPVNEAGKRAHHRLVDQAGNQTCEHCGHTIKRNAVGGIW